MKAILSLVLLVVGCRNNPSTSAFPSVGQMMLAPFHHTKDVAQSYYFTGVPDDNWTPLAKQIWKRDGTNFLGVYMGMIAEWDGSTSVYKDGTMVPNSKPLEAASNQSGAITELVKTFIGNSPTK